MTQTINAALNALGHALPEVAAPVANYVSSVQAGNLLFISGQVSHCREERGVIGTVGIDLSAEDGRIAAEFAALNLLAQIAAATGDRLNAVKRIVRLGVFVASTPSFTRHSQVANGASDLMVAVFGEAGRHARTAIGVSALPSGVAVEVDAVIELAD